MPSRAAETAPDPARLTCNQGAPKATRGAELGPGRLSALLLAADAGPDEACTSALRAQCALSIARLVSPRKSSSGPEGR